MLPYQERVVDCLLRFEDGLAVLGRGLGSQEVLLELALRVLKDGQSDGRHATRLVLLIHTPHEEAEMLVRRAAEDPRWTACGGAAARFIAVGPDMSVDDRAEAYARGGVFAVSARLLVPDLLAGRLVAETLDGILVNHAHSVGELSAEAFVLRIFRRSSKRGFVRGVSDRPDGFAGGDGAVEKIMQRCFLRHLEVWPRIREEVQACLQGCSHPEVQQQSVSLESREKQIQRHLLNIIEGTLEELQRDPNVDLGHLTVQGSLFQTFDMELRQALGPVWQSLGPRTRRTVSDLGGVRQLLAALPRCDAVEFHRLLESMSATEPGREPPAWLTSPDAQALHALAKARVYDIVAPSTADSDFAKRCSEGPTLRRAFGPHAKWRPLLDIIERTSAEEVARVASMSSTVAASVAVAEPSQTLAHKAVEDSEQGRRTEGASLGGAASAVECAGISADCDAGHGEDGGSDLEILSVMQPKRPRIARSSSGVGSRSGGDDNACAALCGDGDSGCSDVIEPRIVVIVPDDWTKRQISSVLHHGPEATVLDLLGAYFRERSTRPADRRRHQTQPQPESAAGQRIAARGPEAALLAREAEAVERERRELPPGGALQVRILEGGQACHPRVDIAVCDGPEGMLRAQLRAVQPHAVVVLEPSLEAIRSVEVFCAEQALTAAVSAVGRLGIKREAALVDLCDGGADAEESPAEAMQVNSSQRTKVYLLAFDDSIEKYRFQQSVARESKAVDLLIRARQHLTIRVDDHAIVAEDALEVAERSTRRGGGSRCLAEMVQQKIVVDMREFRSALPYMLYLRRLVVDPLTIPVGDYILSPDICVERKAIPDLIQSLASGRLYQQAQNMCKYYANPSLLIEFDPGKSFALTNTYMIARREVDVGARDLLGKLALLVLHFPALRLIWSPSQGFTADVFVKLKHGRAQPDPDEAIGIGGGAVEGDGAEDEGDGGGDASVGVDAGGGAPRGRAGGWGASKTNAAALEVLRKLPGVTPRNIYVLAQKAGSLAGVNALSREDLEAAMGKSNARLLYDFLHAQASNLHEAEETTGATAELAAAATVGVSEAPTTVGAAVEAQDGGIEPPPQKRGRRKRAIGAAARDLAIVAATVAAPAPAPASPPASAPRSPSSPPRKTSSLSPEPAPVVTPAPRGFALASAAGTTSRDVTEAPGLPRPVGRIVVDLDESDDDGGGG